MDDHARSAPRDRPPPDEVGRRLRALRRRHALSLRQLSERAGVALGGLSQIERGLTQPTIATLERTATALGVPLSAFFEGEAAEGAVVVRRGRGARLAVAASGIDKTLLTPPSVAPLQLMLVRLEPGASSGPESYVHAGLDAGTVLSGSLNLEVDGRVHVLGAGDGFGFSSDHPHRFENRGAATAEILWINTR